MATRKDIDQMLKDITCRPRMYCGAIETGRDLIFFLQGAVAEQSIPAWGLQARARRTSRHFATMSIIVSIVNHLATGIGTRESSRAFCLRSWATNLLMKCWGRSATYTEEFAAIPMTRNQHNLEPLPSN